MTYIGSPLMNPVEFDGFGKMCIITAWHPMENFEGVNNGTAS